MTLTPSDIQSIQAALQPEFEKTKLEIQAALQPEFEKTKLEIQAALQPEFEKTKLEIQAALQPEFEKIHAQANKNFDTLNKKIESLKRSNRKDHNVIIKAFDEKYHDLKGKVKKLEEKAIFPPFKNI